MDAGNLLRYFSRNAQGTDYAVGDIHGHFSALAQDLSAIGFDEQRDRLFAAGDLVDRGAESAEVLCWLAKPWFFSVKGNHEIMACAALTGDARLTQFHCANGGKWLHRLDKGLQEEIGIALAALPLALEVETSQGGVGLIHADFPTEDWQYLRDGKFSDYDVHYSLWASDRHHMQYEGIIKNIRAVVHGHMIVPRVLVLGNAYFIDTNGGAKGRHFSFLNLETLAATGIGTNARDEHQLQDTELF